MPHLAFHLDQDPSPQARRRFASAVVEQFATIMDTGTDHIAVSVQGYPAGALVFGRVADPGRGLAFVDADIRLGRTREQKRRLALAFMEELERAFGIPARNAYVVYTEHDGEHFHLDDRVLPSWSPGEDPLAGAGS